MILGIGIDTVEIERFSQWHTYSKKKLQRIFSDEEIEYCLSQPNKSAERFAVRFAAREALYKALSYASSHKKILFLTLCKAIAIKKIDSRPYIIIINNEIINDKYGIYLSLSHSNTHAIAFVIIEEK